MNDFIIYVVDGCCYCDKLIDLLKNKSLDYTAIRMEKDSSVLQQVKEAYNWNTTPLIFKRNPRSFKLIGGYDDFKKMINKGWPK
jgi:glutaredoxin